MKHIVHGITALIVLLAVGGAFAQEEGAEEAAVEEAVEEAPAAEPVVISTPAEEIANLYYTYQGVDPTADQIRSGAACVTTMLSMGYTTSALRDAVVKIHQEIPGAASQPIEDIFPSYVNAMKNAAPTTTAVREVEESSSGSSLMPGGLTMFFITYGLANGMGIGITAATEGYYGGALPLSFIPFAGPLIVGGYVTGGDLDDLGPAAGGIVALSALQIVGFTFTMNGAGQNSSAAVDRDQGDRRWAVRNLVVTPTFFGDGGGVFVGARF